ncbi:hypothetical protein [uncultured Algibacter sp.]|uniref:hypothetical protein n=1 Tax=uncultured Algibacter sp. TaxID=298659 RepID=UPI0032178A8B
MIANLHYLHKNTLFILFIFTFLFNACSKEETREPDDNDSDSGEEVTNPPISEERFNADINEDGTLNILLLGPSKSIDSQTSTFALAPVVQELNNILSQDNAISTPINIEYKDTYKVADVDVNLGSGNQILTYKHYAHSLVQYYYWPDNQDERLANLKGEGDKDWDYVIIAADPYIVSKTPGFYSLGLNKIAEKVEEGNAKTMALLLWPKEQDDVANLELLEEFNYRIATTAKASIEVVPAGLAWEALSTDLKDTQSTYPSPNGAYLTASAIYTQLYGENASTSNYNYNDALADAVLLSVKSAKTATHFSGTYNFTSPFKGTYTDTPIIRFNHTGTSSENGIIGGLQWVVNKVTETELVRDGAPKVNFNIGRANTNFEANKRYKIDASKFDSSFGFPMQDGGQTGDVSMLYGIDKRRNDTENGTDLGVALYMTRQNELPTARAIPIRTLYAQMKALGIANSAYRDNWHMSRDLDRASGAFIYTLLTGKCDLGEEPTDASSGAWRAWSAHKVGYETAWNLMTLQGKIPDCN